MTKSIADSTRSAIKEWLAKCTEKEQFLFKRMYSHTDVTLPINDVVDLMAEENLDRALTQCQRTAFGR